MKYYTAKLRVGAALVIYGLMEQTAMLARATQWWCSVVTCSAARRAVTVVAAAFRKWKARPQPNRALQPCAVNQQRCGTVHKAAVKGTQGPAKEGTGHHVPLSSRWGLAASRVDRAVRAVAPAFR